MDLYLAVYPGFVLARLQIPLGKKLGLISALSIGMVGTVVAAYKCTRLKVLGDEPSRADPSCGYNRPRGI